MTTHTNQIGPRRRALRLGPLLLGAVLGAAVAVALGLLLVRIAPDDGFSDLAAAAVTRVVLAPLGAALGAAVAMWRRK